MTTIYIPYYKDEREYKKLKKHFRKGTYHYHLRLERWLKVICPLDYYNGYFIVRVTRSNVYMKPEEFDYFKKYRERNSKDLIG